MPSVPQPSARWLALVTATAIVLYLCWRMLFPFIDVLLWATVLAMIAWPAQLQFRRRGWSAHISAMLTTSLVVLIVLIPLTLVTTAVVREGSKTIETFRQELPKLIDPNSKLFKSLEKYVDLDALRDPKKLSDKIGEGWKAVANRTPSIIGGIIGGAIGTLIEIFFILFTLYYLLRDAERIIPAVRDSLPLSRSNADVIFKRTGEVIAASFNGVLVISAIQGLLGMIAFYALGIPGALLWGVVMFLLSTIPMLGAFIVWVPAAIYLLGGGHWIKALILAIWGAGVIGMIDNILRPKLVGKRAKLHELIIFFSVLGGLQVFGVLGLFVGPVVAAIAIALLNIWSGERSDKPEATTDMEAPRGFEVVIHPAPLPLRPDAPHPVPHKTAGSD